MQPQPDKKEMIENKYRSQNYRQQEQVNVFNPSLKESKMEKTESLVTPAFVTQRTKREGFGRHHDRARSPSSNSLDEVKSNLAEKHSNLTSQQ